MAFKYCESSLGAGNRSAWCNGAGNSHNRRVGSSSHGDPGFRRSTAGQAAGNGQARGLDRMVVAARLHHEDISWLQMYLGDVPSLVYTAVVDLPAHQQRCPPGEVSWQHLRLPHAYPHSTAWLRGMQIQSIPELLFQCRRAW